MTLGDALTALACSGIGYGVCRFVMWRVYERPGGRMDEAYEEGRADVLAVDEVRAAYAAGRAVAMEQGEGLEVLPAPLQGVHSAGDLAQQDQAGRWPPDAQALPAASDPLWEPAPGDLITRQAGEHYQPPPTPSPAWQYVANSTAIGTTDGEVWQALQVLGDNTTFGEWEAQACAHRCREITGELAGLQTRLWDGFALELPAWAPPRHWPALMFGGGS